jgi:hypothetical protein
MSRHRESTDFTKSNMMISSILAARLAAFAALPWK